MEALFSVIGEIFLKIPNLVASLLLSLPLSVSVTCQPGCTWSHDVRKGTDVTGLSGQIGFTGNRWMQLMSLGILISHGRLLGRGGVALHAGGSRGRSPDGIESEGRDEGEQEEDEECRPGVRMRGVE